MPRKRIPTPPQRRKPSRRFPAEPLGLADVEALCAACSRRAPTGIRNRALLAVLFRSGLHVSEALALFPKDIAAAGGSLRVLHGKSDKARTAPLPSDAAEAVDRWLDCRKRLGLTRPPEGWRSPAVRTSRVLKKRSTGWVSWSSTASSALGCGQRRRRGRHAAAASRDHRVLTQALA
jgi:site-specific recombinase XerD